MTREKISKRSEFLSTAFPVDGRRNVYLHAKKKFLTTSAASPRHRKRPSSHNEFEIFLKSYLSTFSNSHIFYLRNRALKENISRNLGQWGCNNSNTTLKKAFPPLLRKS